MKDRVDVVPVEVVLTLQAVGMACHSAFLDEDVPTLQRVLFAVCLAGLLDLSNRPHASLREIRLALLRGGTVFALFVAQLEFGEAEEQLRRAGLSAVAAGLLSVLVLIGHARRAADARDERRQLAGQLAELVEGLAKLNHARPAQEVLPRAAPTSESSAWPITVVGALGVLVGSRMRR